MIPSVFGGLVLVVALVLMFRATPLGMLMFMLGCTLFGGSAALILPAIGGSSISPAHLALGFLVARIVAPGSSDIGKIAGGLRANVFLAFYGIYGAVTAFILPRVFAGQIDVAPMRTVTVRGLYDTFPLAFGPQNITTAVYLIGTCLAAICATVVARRPHSMEKIVTTTSIMAWVHVGFGVLGVVLAHLGLAHLLDVFRNGSYAQLEQSYGEIVRVAGVFPEASAYAGYGFTWFVFNFECWLRDVKPRATGPAALALLLILFFSTSGSAYVALAGYGVVLLLRMLMMPDAFRIKKLSAIGMSLVLATLVAILALVLSPDLAAQMIDMVRHMTLDKADSESGRQRSFWAMQGVHAFQTSWGLGIGAGSFRSSSLPTAILGSVGVFGVATFVAHVLRVVQPLRRSTYMPVGDKRTCAGAAASWTVVAILIPASVGGASPDPGMSFAVLGGLALGWRLSPEAARAPAPAAPPRRRLDLRTRLANSHWRSS